MKQLVFRGCMVMAALLLLPGQGAFAENPFFGRGSGQAETQETTPLRDAPALWGIPFFQEIMALQREVRQKMTDFARQIQEKPSGSAMFRFMGLALAYGVLHALGPGHGKSIVCSYFLSRRGRYSQAVLFGNCLSFAHVVSATLIVLLLSVLGSQVNIFAFHNIENSIETFSYLLIGLVGLFLLFNVLRELRAGIPADGEHGAADGKSMAALSLSAGLIPCPGAAIILLFSLSQGILWAGLLAMVPLAVGMGMTTSVVGLATIGSRAVALGAVSSFNTLFVVLYTTLAMAGALLITLFGWGLFLHSL